MRRQSFLLAVTAAAALGLMVLAAFFHARAPREAAPAVAATLPPAATTSAPVPLAPAALPATHEPAAALSSADQIKARSDTAAALQAALVNILCVAPRGSAFRSITASGVVITPSGYVLTSAHVAAYFLLADQGISCTLRTGSPAADAYIASIAFISPNWVANNAQVLLEDAPTGTGQYDFALLAITGSATKASLPTSFPYLPLATADAAANAPVVVGSYGAEGLSTSQVESALSPTLVPGAVTQVLTFAKTTPDVLEISGSAAAEEGSSGGGVATLDGELAGSITTSSNAGTIASRTLSALSASYIRREYKLETGDSLAPLLSIAPSAQAAAFAPTASSLETILLAAAHAH